MTEIECTKGLSYLGMAYGKEFTPQECQVHYDFLKEYSYETFVAAIKSIIKKSKFLPKITEILEECNNCKEQVKIEVLEFMNKIGYFKDYTEYTKTNYFVTRGIVPEWLQNDINKYYKIMQQEKISVSETLKIGQKV